MVLLANRDEEREVRCTVGPHCKFLHTSIEYNTLGWREDLFILRYERVIRQKQTCYKEKSHCVLVFEYRIQLYLLLDLLTGTKGLEIHGTPQHAKPNQGNDRNNTVIPGALRPKNGIEKLWHLQWDERQLSHRDIPAEYRSEYNCTN